MDKEAFYQSRRWKSLRQSILRRDKYQCQICKRYGRHTEAKEVHHIEHLEDNPARAYDPTNLISLCHACHRRAHPEKAEALNKGREMRRY